MAGLGRSSSLCCHTGEDYPGISSETRADNAELMLIITRQSQPVTQVLIAFKELFLPPGTSWIWGFLGKMSGPGCPRLPRHWAPAQSNTCPSCSHFSEFPAVLTFICTGCDPILWQSSLRYIRSLHQGQQSDSKDLGSHLAFPCCAFPKHRIVSSGTNGFPQVVGGRGINLTLKNNSVTATEFHIVTKTPP